MQATVLLTIGLLSTFVFFILGQHLPKRAFPHDRAPVPDALEAQKHNQKAGVLLLSLFMMFSLHFPDRVDFTPFVVVSHTLSAWTCACFSALARKSRRKGVNLLLSHILSHTHKIERRSFPMEERPAQANLFFSVQCQA